MSNTVKDLEQVSRILRENALQQHRRNVADHDALVAEVAHLDDMRAATRDQGASSLHQAAGADVLWQSWLVKRRTELMQKTAMARAVQGESLARAQYAFARHRAVELLLEEDAKAQRSKLLRQDDATVDALNLLQAQMAQRK